MLQRGDCLCCSKIQTCTETSVERARGGYTCPVFSPISEPEWLARWTSMLRFGEVIAVQAMMDRPSEEEVQEDTEEDDGPEL